MTARRSLAKFNITFIGSLSGKNIDDTAITTAATVGTTATIAKTTDGSSPTAALVQASLNTIAALTGNVLVTGNPGGPYTVEFTGFARTNVNQLTVTSDTGLTVTPFTQADGNKPTVAQVQARLDAIPAIGATNTVVTGSTGGPFTITFQNALARTDVLLVSATGTGVTASTTLTKSFG